MNTVRSLRIAVDPLRVAEGFGCHEPGQMAAMWVGNTLRVEVGVFPGGKVADLSALEWSSMTLRLKPSQTDLSTTWIEKTISPSDPGWTFSITKEDWESGTACHLSFELSAAETNIPLGKVGRKVAWMALSGLMFIGAVQTLAAGPILLIQDNDAPAPLAPPNPGTAATVEEMMALIRDGAELELGEFEAVELVPSHSFVHLISGGMMLPADCALGREAHGFVLSTASPGASVKVFRSGVLNGLAGIGSGTSYWLGVYGQATATPAESGISQSLGIGIGGDSIFVSIEPHTVLAS